MRLSTNIHFQTGQPTQMSKPGVITIYMAPSSTVTWNAVVAKTPDAVDANGYPALDADDETVLDLVAWPLDRPDRFATALGVAEGLGLARVCDPATVRI